METRVEMCKIPLVPVSEQVPLWVSEVKFEEQVDIVLGETWEQSRNQWWPENGWI